MVGEFYAGKVELAAGQYHQYAVVAGKFAQQGAAAIVVQPHYIEIEPHLAPAKCADSFFLEGEPLYFVLCHEVALGTTSLDGYFGEVDVEGQCFEPVLGLQGNLHGLGLAVGVGGEPCHTHFRQALHKLIVLVACQARRPEALHVVHASAACLVYHVECQAFVLATVYVDVEHVLSDKQLFLHAGYLVVSVAVEHDYIIERRAVGHELVLFESCAHEALLAVDVEFLVGFGHGACLDSGKASYGRMPRECFAVFVFEFGVPSHGFAVDVRQAVESVVDFCLQGNESVGCGLGVEAQDAFHFYLQQPQEVVACHIPGQRRLERLEPAVDVCQRGIEVGGLFVLPVLVDPFLDEYFFQRCVQQLFAQFGQRHLQFACYYVAGGVHAVAEHIAHAQEAWFVVADYAAVGGYVDFAVGKGVQGVDGLVGGCAGLQMHEDGRRGCGVVLHLADFYLPAFEGFENRLY